MPNRRRHNYPGAVDRLLDKLTPQSKEAFLDFANSAKTLIELKTWWSERNIDVSLDALSTWRKKHLKAGELAEAAILMLDKAKGIDGKSVLEFVACTAIILSGQIQEKLEQEYCRGDIQVLLNALKEARSSAVALADLQAKADRIESVLAGSYELFDRALRTAGTDPKKEWLEAVLKSGLASIEQEIKAETLAGIS